MSKDEIKFEISKVLDHFSDSALQELLSFLKKLEQQQGASILNSDSLRKILSEDRDLLKRLAQ
jgi:site-specific DNA-adenine methylase